MNKSKYKWVYLVYCNRHPPLVYGIYQNKKKAVQYAYDLIKYRRDWATKNNLEFDFYHINDYNGEKQRKLSPDHPEWREKTIFTACLKVKDRDGKPDKYYDGCFIQVIRRVITN